MAKRGAGETRLPTGTQRQEPYVAPGVSPEAAYKAGVAARNAQRRAARGQAPLPKTQTPVAGGPVPAIPRLDEPHAEGMTMQQQAEAVRQADQTSGVTPDHGGIVEMPQNPNVPSSPAQLGLLPTDTLPPEATQDPAFQQGHGSMVAVHQPQLALKYGVVRNGQVVPPQKLGPQRAQLRPESIRDLETINKLQQQQQGQEPVAGLHASEQEAEKSLDGSGVAAAARVGNLTGDEDEKPITEEERKKLKEAVGKLDEFDLDSFRQAMMKDILNNPDQQKVIEAKLNPLSMDELLMKNRVTQTVPINSQLNYTFQSQTGEEDLEIKRLIVEESKSIEVSDRYLLDKYSYMSIAIGLVAINGKPLGTHLDAEGNFNDEKFWEKFNKLQKYPLHMLASIGVNLFWFEARVRKMFVAEKVGNG